MIAAKPAPVAALVLLGLWACEPATELPGDDGGRSDGAAAAQDADAPDADDAGAAPDAAADATALDTATSADRADAGAGQDSGGTDAATLSDASGGVDQAPAPDAGGAADASVDTLVFPATVGVYNAAFDLSSSSPGGGRLVYLDVVSNLSDLQISRTRFLGFSWLRHSWESAAYTVYDVISVAEGGNDLLVTYLYCQGDQLAYAYTESFTMSLDWEQLSGDCTVVEQSTPTDVSVPALHRLPAGIDTGIRISGPQISLDGPAGEVVAEGTTWRLIPFETVDCRECPDGPWLEIHNMLVVQGEACFAIIYLYPGTSGTVDLYFGICLPTLRTINANFADTEWSGEIIPDSSPPPPRPGPWPLPRPRPPR